MKRQGPHVRILASDIWMKGKYIPAAGVIIEQAIIKAYTVSRNTHH